MPRARIVNVGDAQTIQIPKEFHLTGEYVEVRQEDGVLILMPEPDAWSGWEENLHAFSDDYMEVPREQGVLSSRQIFFP